MLVGIIFTFTVLYRWALGAFEGVEVSFVHSLRVVIEVLTTAGFGGDTDYWRSPQLHVLILVMNVTAVVIIFIAVPMFGIPLLRRAVQDRPPTESTLTDHVIICGYSPQDEVLRAELEPHGIPYLYVDDDAELITDLNDRGINAIHGNPENLSTLKAANIQHARAILADMSDEINPTIILSARKLNPNIRTISVIRDHKVEEYHRYAGADDVVVSRHHLGKSLGMRAAASWAEKLQACIEVESTFEFTELLVEEGSELVGQTLKETEIFQQRGITVIGAWLGGKFVVSPPPNTRISANAILLVAGDQTEFASVQARAIRHSPDQPARVILCGYGTVGWSAQQTLEREGIEVTVIDKDGTKEGLDIVGDVTDPATFERAKIQEARAVVLALNSDTSSIYATLVINQLAPDVEIIARAKNPSNVWKLYSAGADFVLSLVTVTGETVASLLIEDDDIITSDIEFEFKRVKFPDVEDRLLADLDIRAKTGCTVVAIERDGELVTDLMGEDRVRRGDTVVVAGTEKAFAKLAEQLGTIEE